VPSARAAKNSLSWRVDGRSVNADTLGRGLPPREASRSRHENLAGLNLQLKDGVSVTAKLVVKAGRSKAEVQPAAA
jgi:hypothetical protein